MSQAFSNDAKSHEQIDHHVQKEAQSPGRLMVLKKIKFLNWNQNSNFSYCRMILDLLNKHKPHYGSIWQQ